MSQKTKREICSLIHQKRQRRTVSDSNKTASMASTINVQKKFLNLVSVP